jgi:hypothetical protein
MLNHKVTSKRRKSRNPLIERLFGQSQVKTNTNSLSQPLFNPITRLFPTANKAIESQSEISLRSSAGGPTIGVANGTKTKEDLNISPPPKSRKMKIELQMSDKPLIITSVFNQIF